MRLIDADKLIALLNKKYGVDDINESVLYLVGAISGATTVDAEAVKHGHWDEEMGGYVCSVCEGYSEFATNYCPYCGAKMDEVREDEQ